VLNNDWASAFMQGLRTKMMSKSRLQGWQNGKDDPVKQ